MPGRPVISNNKNISPCLVYHLKSLLLNIPHILEDITDLLCRIWWFSFNEIDKIHDNAILVSFDVLGLYPNVPHEKGMEAICQYLETRSDKSVSTNSLCDLASIILRMGSWSTIKKVVPLLRPSSLLHILTCLWQGSKRELFKAVSLSLSCGSDNLMIFFLYMGPRFPKMKRVFFYCINSLHPTIKFIMGYSTTEINFLDVTVTKVGNKLEIDSYFYTANQPIRISTFMHNHATVMSIKIYSIGTGCND